MLDLELIRTQNPIELVVGERFPLRRSGTHWIGIEHDSLVVNPITGWYHWNSKDERGDVFDFVMRYLLPNANPHDPQAFVEALNYLAKRAGISLPAHDNGHGPRSALGAERELVRRLHAVLCQTPAAWTYATTGRGWNKVTLQGERVGFMPQEKGLLLKGLDTLPERWRGVIQRFPAGMLVYSHWEQGRLVYLSGRGIHAKQHYNPPADLIGKRHAYFNHLYRPDVEQVYVVEGQADAITFAQWGLPAVALVGMHGDNELVEQVRRHKRVFVMLDNTPDAQRHSFELARAIGLNAYLPNLPDGIKDVNEWLVQAQASTSDIQKISNHAPSLLEREVTELIFLQGLERQDALESLIKTALAWDKRHLHHLRQLLKDHLHLSYTHFNDLLKLIQTEQTGTVNEPTEDSPLILSDTIPQIAPALGFLPDVAMVTVAIMERTRENRLYLHPYLVTSQRTFLRLDKAQVIALHDQEIALRVMPEATEFLQRWRYSDIQKFLTGEVVSPGEVFQNIHGLYTQHIDFASPLDSQVVTLWVIGTYFYTLFGAYPYLALNGPKNSGKSTLLNVTKPLAFNMLTTSDVTGPSLFRLIHQNSCSVGIDEAERYHSARDPEMLQIRQLLNSGYKPGMPAIRLMGDEMRPQAFDVYSPKVLANIAGLEDILASRCIPIPMRRAEHKLPPFSPNFDGSALRHQLYTLALTHFRAIHHNVSQRPELHTLINRSHELWSPLVALAAFFEEEGGIAGLLDNMRTAANRDQRLSEGKALSQQEESVLQALELLTRQGGDIVWVKGSVLREQIAVLLEIGVEKMQGAQWLGHVLKRLQLTDRTRSKHHEGGQMYAIVREEVLEMMRRYEVPFLETP